MEEEDIIICGNCYQENKKGKRYCEGCGKPLYYNEGITEIALIDNKDDKIDYYDKNNFDTSIKFDKNIMAVNKKEQKLYFFFDEVLDKIIPFNSIVECQIIENSNVMESGGVGRALVGGLIAGRNRCHCWCYYKKK